MYRRFITGAVVMLLYTSMTYAQDTCTAIVEAALRTVADACSTTSRNQACYGNIQLQAEGRTPDLAFERVGDVASVSDIESLALSPLDESARTWGVALFSLQANLPDTLPGQNVILLALGDISLTNAVPPSVTLQATATANARVRRAPDTTTENVIAVLPSGSQMTVIGRNEAADWVRVLVEPGVSAATLGMDNPSGWTSRQVVSVQGNVMDLPVLDVNERLRTPMQAYLLRSGIGAGGCAEAPPDGILVQSPSGGYRVTLNVNGVQIGLGSTAYMQAADGAFTLTLLEGAGFVEAEGQMQLVPPGTQVRVPLTDDLSAPAGPPEMPQPASASLTAVISDVIAALAQEAPAADDAAVISPVSISEPLAEDAIEDALAAARNAFGLLPGMWQITTTNIVTYRDEWGPQFNVNICFAGFSAAIGQTSVSYIDWTGRPYSDGVYDDPLSAHARTRSRALAVGESEYLFSTIVESPTRARFLYTAHSHVSTEGRQDAGQVNPGVFLCEFTYEYVWIGD